MMNYQHIENLLIRFRGQRVSLKSISASVYEGLVVDVTNDYVSLKVRNAEDQDELVIVLFHSIESVLPQRK